MTKSFVLMAFAALSGIPAFSASLIFSATAVASGTVGTQAFTNADLTLTFDQAGPLSNNTVFGNNATLLIAGIGTIAFTQFGVSNTSIYQNGAVLSFKPVSVDCLIPYLKSTTQGLPRTISAPL